MGLNHFELEQRARERVDTALDEGERSRRVGASRAPVPAGSDVRGLLAWIQDLAPAFLGLSPRTRHRV